MRVAFLTSDKAREHLLADAFLMGAAKHGHSTEVLALQPEPVVGEYDVAAMVGVKSNALWRAHHRAGIPTIYLDKGYTRGKEKTGLAGWEFWRVAINAHQPTSRLEGATLPHDRLERLGLTLRPWREAGAQIVLAGSSAKYHAFHGLSEPTAYASKVVREIGALGLGHRIVYRPKPSWREAVPVKGAEFDQESDFSAVLAGAHCLVTHGSNACFDAMVAGIPSIILGDAVAKPISSTTVEGIRKPRLVKEKVRRQLLANLAYWQWSRAEMASGEAWAFIGKELHG